MNDTELHQRIDDIVGAHFGGHLDREETRRALERLWLPHRGVYDHEWWPITTIVHFDDPSVPANRRWRYVERSDFALRQTVVHVWLAPGVEG